MENTEENLVIKLSPNEKLAELNPEGILTLNKKTYTKEEVALICLGFINFSRNRTLFKKIKNINFIK